MTEAEKIRYERYRLAYAALMLCYPFGLEDLDGEIWAWIAGYEGDPEFGAVALAKKFSVNLRTMQSVISGSTYKNVK